MDQNDTEILTRPLSRHERYSLVRRHIGSPSVLTYIITFKKDAPNVPSTESLQKRMQQLVKQYPILSSRVDKSWTSKPVLEQITLSDTTVSQRVKAKSDQAAEGIATTEAIFEECLKWSTTLDPENGDLWRIGRFTNETTGEVAVIFSVDHILGDGRGSLNFLPLLINPDVDTSSPSSLLPPALEESIDVKPAISTVLKAILQSLIFPKLPTWMIPTFFLPTSFWPYLPNGGSSSTSKKQILPLEASVGVLVAKWSAKDITQLTAAFARTGVSTALQGIIAACSMAALWLSEQDVESPDSSDVNLKLTTPTSERNASLGHPQVLGNFVGAVDTEARVTGTSDLTSLAQQYSLEVNQAKARKSPPRAFGLLDYIDDPEITNESGSELTGWDKFFLEKAASKTSFGSSIEISNVGLAPALDPMLQSSVKSVDWMQTPTAVGAALDINVVGGQPAESGARYGDIRMSVTWRKDSAPGGRLSDERVNNFRRILVKLPAVVNKLNEEGSPLSLSALAEQL